MIAISYRREDSLAVAGRLYDRLQTKFGKKNVFMDFDSIPPGADFRQHIKQMIERSNLVIAIIGPHWLGEQPDASRRIDNPADFVRLEIGYALEAGIPVIPLLINTTQMLKPEMLPPDIQELAFRHALPLDSGMDFHSHADRLITGIHKAMAIAPRSGGRQQVSKPTATAANARRLSKIVIWSIAIPLAAASLALAVRYAAMHEPHPAKQVATANESTTRDRPEQVAKNSGAPIAETKSEPPVTPAVEDKRQSEEVAAAEAKVKAVENARVAAEAKAAEATANVRLSIPLEPRLKKEEWGYSFEARAYGFIDPSGKEVVEPKWDNTKGFSEGLAAVSRGGKWGYIDRSGKIVIEPKWENVNGFSEGLAAVSKVVAGFRELPTRGEKWGYIDRSGKIVIEPKWDINFSGFSDGLALVARLDKKNGLRYIDRAGAVVIEPKWDTAWPFSEGLAKVGRTQAGKSQYGFIDRTGALVIEPKWEAAYGFSEGLAQVERGGRGGYIDRNGTIVVEPKWKQTGTFHEGLASAGTDKKLGYIDRSGTFVIEPKWESASDFRGGLALVRRDGKDAFIDRSGKVVVEPNCENAGFEKGEDGKTYLFIVRLRTGENSKGGSAQAFWLDSTGKEIWHSP
jgi:hypothetical protein